MNPKKLARIVDASISRDYASGYAAAKSCGLVYNQLKRFRSDPPAWISEVSLAGLYKLVGDARRSDLTDTIQTSRAKRVHQTYTSWVLLELVRVRGGHARPDEVRARRRALARLSSSLQQRFPRQFSDLKAASRCAQGISPARVKLAYLRVVAPLLDSFDTHGVEREAGSFKEPEIKQFLSAGVKRECLLLRREGDEARAGKAVNRSRSARQGRQPSLRASAPTNSGSRSLRVDGLRFDEGGNPHTDVPSGEYLERLSADRVSTSHVIPAEPGTPAFIAEASQALRKRAKKAPKSRRQSALAKKSR